MKVRAPFEVRDRWIGYRGQWISTLTKGAIVRVKNLHGCPPCNTMGHAHVVDPDTDKFIGLVCAGSLRPMADLDVVIAELKVELAKKAAERGVSLC